MVEAGYKVIGITLQLYDYGQVAQRKVLAAQGETFMMPQWFAENGLSTMFLTTKINSKGVIQDFVDTYLNR